jgi:hypothetical protein
VLPLVDKFSDDLVVKLDNVAPPRCQASPPRRLQSIAKTAVREFTRLPPAKPAGTLSYAVTFARSSGHRAPPGRVRDARG